jgi:hypothetical protein
MVLVAVAAAAGFDSEADAEKWWDLKVMWLIRNLMIPRVSQLPHKKGNLRI